MATKTEAYLDTSALIAFLDRSDSYHPPLASALVIAEGHGWFLRRYDQRRAVEFLNFIDDLTVLTIQRFDREELTKTARLVKKFAERSLTLADAHGLVMMNERHIANCWSTDRHLALTGARLATSSVGAG